MARQNFHDDLAFLAVARERSFTRAAAQLGVSQSTLSQTVKQLEARLGIRLLTRTTRSVAPTEAGERLLRNLAPHFREIEAEIAAIGDLRDTPAGTVRITATDYAANTVLWPKLSTLLPAYPDLRIEIAIDYGLRDIVADRFDIGMRFCATLRGFIDRPHRRQRIRPLHPRGRAGYIERPREGDRRCPKTVRRDEGVTGLARYPIIDGGFPCN